MDNDVSPLAMLRKIRGNITQSELGQVIGVTGNTVARWERGEQQAKLTPAQFKKLCKFLAISIEDLPESFAPQPIDRGSSSGELTSG